LVVLGPFQLVRDDFMRIIWQIEGIALKQDRKAKPHPGRHEDIIPSTHESALGNKVGTV
jgi:hypothetical protein